MSRLQRALPWLAGLIILSFVHNGFIKQSRINLNDWNTRTCLLEHSRHYKAIGNCTFELRQAMLYSLPYLRYGEHLTCERTNSVAESTFANSHCLVETDVWTGPKKLFEIGWDAYSVWYLRAVALYFESQRPEWPGTLKALNDPPFISSFPAPEHVGYPWLVPIVYSKLLKFFHSPSPLPLQILQVFILLFVACLYRKTWPQAPLSFWIYFALIPIGGKFLLMLYADLWLISFLLLFLWALQKGRYLVAIVPAALAIWTKQEGWSQVLALFLTFLALTPELKINTSRVRVIALGIMIGSVTFVYLCWAKQWHFEPYYTSLSVRLLDIQSYTYRLPRILGYFLDVLFRPHYWIFLWPILAWLFWFQRKKLRFAVLPSLWVLLLIPLAYLRYPDGSFKEVVLTGSPRALWQMFPMLWLLTQHAYTPIPKAHRL